MRDLAAERQRIADVGLVKLARIAVPGIGRPGDRTWRAGVADHLDRADAGIGPVALPRQQVVIERVVRDPRGDHDDRVAAEPRRGAGVDAFGLDATRMQRRNAGVQRDLHAVFDQPAMDRPLFERVQRPVRDIGRGGDKGDAAAGLGQQLGHHPAHVIMVIVEDHHRALRQAPGHDVVRREDRHRRIGGHRHDMLTRDAIGAPMRPGRDADILEAEVEDLLRAQTAVEIGLDVRALAQLIGAVIRDPAPGRQPGQLALARDAATKLGAGLGERHVIAAQGERAGSFQPGRPRADDQHVAAVALRVHLLGVPTLAPFFHEGRVLRAAADAHRHVAGDADVAADAFADVLDPAFLDLLRQEGIGDRGPGAADEIEHTLPHQPRHHIGRGEAADADDGARGQLANAGHQHLLRRLFLEARGARAILPGALRQIPQVGQIGVHLDELAQLGVREAKRADVLVKAHPQRQPHRVADRVAHVGDHLVHEPRPVLERAAVFVRPLVRRTRQEMLEDAEAMRAVQADQIETRQFRALGRVHEPAAQVPDIGLVHRARLHRVVGEGANGQRRRGKRHFLGIKVRPVDAGIGKLDARERAARLHRVRHPVQRRNIGIVPQPQLDEGGDFRGVVHLGLLGEDHTPAALGLDPAHRCGGRGVAIAAAIAMRNLIEAVLRGQGPDLRGLEQDVIGWVSHVVSLPAAGLAGMRGRSGAAAPK
ncbi:hypothetical protein SDC9_26081 [bioreactor metagenome]|uniref:Uncharacterized protein n=1 Tax=bioreactor metagenome TaxID=1076179 RepID=A0A644UMP9_9ZZZZ